MKKVYLQYWEESERNWGIRPDGCSLHLNLIDCENYIKDIYKNRNSSEVPYEYDRIIGETIEVEIKESLYNSIENGTLRLARHQLTNLIKLEDIII